MSPPRDPYAPIDLGADPLSNSDRLKQALSREDDSAILSAFRLLEASGRSLEMNPDEQMHLADALARGGMHIQAIRLYQELRIEKTPEADFKIAALWLGPAQRAEEGQALLAQLAETHPNHPLLKEAQTVLAQIPEQAQSIYSAPSPPPTPAQSPTPAQTTPTAQTAPTAQAAPAPGAQATPAAQAAPALPEQTVPELSTWGLRAQALFGPVGSNRYKLSMRLLQVILLASIAGLLTGYLSKDRYRNLEEVHPALLQEPKQTELAEPIPIAHDIGKIQVRLNPRYGYELAGLVVSKMGYGSWWLKGMDDIAPTDLCLIWGKNIKKGWFRSPDLGFHQNFRKCYVKWTCGLPFESQAFSNNHIVATAEVQAQLDDLEIGDQIKLYGRLVNVRAIERGTAMHALGFGSSDYSWNTSTKRDDKGMGACEVIFVEKLDLLRRAPRWPHQLFRLSFGAFLLAVGLLIFRAGTLPFSSYSRQGRKPRRLNGP